MTLNLLDGSHRDYMKPGQVINYVHVDSNHPPTVTKSIGQGVNYRLNALWKAAINQSQKLRPNVCFHIHREGWVPRGFHP